MVYGPGFCPDLWTSQLIRIRIRNTLLITDGKGALDHGPDQWNKVLFDQKRWSRSGQAEVETALNNRVKIEADFLVAG